MKTLYLVRHAKSSWEFNLDDHMRPLASRGLNDAPLVAKHIKSLIKRPDLIISSDALRAKTTALLYLKELGISEYALQLEPKVYDFSGKALDDVIKNVDDAVEVLMIFGHNNALTNLVNYYGDKKIDNVSTAAFTAIEFETESWEAIKKGTTTHFIKPKDLK